MAVRMIPAHEVVEAAAWMAGPFALLLAALWVAIARRSNKRDKRFADEQTRIEEQAAAERLAAWRETHR